MAKAGGKGLELASPHDAVPEALSDVRTTVLGPQILLGFQYQALFQPGFARLEPWRQGLAFAALGLLIVTVALVLAPASHHQLAEAGRRTAPQAAFTQRMLTTSLAPFALAIGVSVLLVSAGEFGAAIGVPLGAAAAGLCLWLWYGIEIMVRRPASPARDARPPATSLKDEIADMMTETRIVLPGVQALLGFQFAAYLSDVFARLPPHVRAAHDAGLAFLLTSMILLMTPAPFHRLAERGEASARTGRLGRACILAALAMLALGLSADAYVAAEIIAGGRLAAALAAGFAAAAALGLWFAVPLAKRRSRPQALLRISSKPKLQA